MLIEEVLEDYDMEKKIFNLEKLQSRAKLHGEDKKAFADELRKLVVTLYQSI
jgi:hypothetical protein